MKLILCMLGVVMGEAIEDMVQVVAREPNNPSITTDPYYGKTIGTVDTLAEDLQMPNEEVRVANSDKVKVKPWSSSAAKYYFPVVGVTYCKDKELLAFNGTYSRELGPKFHILKILNHATLDTRAIVAVNTARKEIILAFRGTHSNTNWVENVVFSQTSINVTPQASVHTGFKNIADAMAPEFIHILKRLLAKWHYKDYDVVVTGHSLGGAVAQIASIQVHRDLKIGWERVKVITFGQPRVGNLDFARWFNQQPVMYTRVVNENDLVPHVPPIFTGYMHTHLERYIEKGKSRICNTDSMEDSTCSASRLSTLTSDAHNDAWYLKNNRLKC
ncbi:hypothetical protein DSO57_1033578 [Entomophthora muscae]|uniref:Uncharacterized protein n=1 Tax=Entomophthora muscae TaxID=34485 RepID=A0ACC2SCQ7_9FUNG|nr:hypothetical protein DSO57_1033578 [Entomophthora muscae]